MANLFLAFSQAIDVVRYGRERADFRRKVVDTYLSDTRRELTDPLMGSLALQLTLCSFGRVSFGEEFSYFRSRIAYYEAIARGEDPDMPVVYRNHRFSVEPRDIVNSPRFRRQCEAAGRVMKNLGPL